MSRQIHLSQTKNRLIHPVALELNNRTRYIGKLDLSGEGTFIAFRKSSHIFKKTNSIGINYELLHDASIRFKWINIILDGKKLISTREYYLKKGTNYRFANKSFELQTFVPIDELNLETIHRFEQSFEVQEDLFNKIQWGY